MQNITNQLKELQEFFNFVEKRDEELRISSLIKRQKHSWQNIM